MNYPPLQVRYQAKVIVAFYPTMDKIFACLICFRSLLFKEPFCLPSPLFIYGMRALSGIMI